MRSSVLLIACFAAIATTASAQKPGRIPPPKAPGAPAKVDGLSVEARLATLESDGVELRKRVTLLEKENTQLKKDLAAATAKLNTVNGEMGAAKMLVSGLDKAAGEMKKSIADLNAAYQGHSHEVGLWLHPITKFGKMSNNVVDLEARTGMLIGGTSEAAYKQNGNKIWTTKPMTRP